MKFNELNETFINMGLYNTSLTDPTFSDILDKALLQLYNDMRQSTPGLSRDQFLTILDNADDWNSFYNGTFYILWNDELENLYPTGMPSNMREMWTKIRELVENLWSFTVQYVDPLGMGTSALTSYLEALAELSFYNVDTDNVKLLFLVS